MSEPPRGRKRPTPASPLEEDFYTLREPAPKRAVPEFLVQPKEPLLEARKPPPPPRLPLLTGVFSFPWYWRTFPIWVLMSLGLIIGSEMVLLAYWMGSSGGARFAHPFALAALWTLAFALSFASAWCLAVIEQTSLGYDTIEEWPMMDWRERFCTFPTTLGMLGVALAIGGGIQALGIAPSPYAMLTVAFFLYPVLLLSALENGSPLSPLSRVIRRSLVNVWWAWGLFYVETGVLLVVWALAVVPEFPYQPFAVTLFAMPPLAAIFLIYARLLGRLIWCIGQHESSP